MEEKSKTNTLLNLTSVTKDNNIIITPNENSKAFLSYLRDNINITNDKDRREFITGTERIIRISNDYKVYIAHLKEDVPGCRSCALFNHITDEMAPLEMHHGPIFTLAEIVTIVLNHFVKTGKEISSFKIADQVLEDHFDHLIQTVFLCKSAHAIVSDKKIGKEAFISMEHVPVGDIVEFITKYNDAITYYEINKLRNYLYMSELYAKNEGTSIYTFLKERVKSFKDAKPEE